MLGEDLDEEGDVEQLEVAKPIRQRYSGYEGEDQPGAGVSWGVWDGDGQVGWGGLWEVKGWELVGGGAGW